MNTNAQRIAAFFDIDGTLVAPPSLERQFLRYLIWRRELPSGAWLRWGSRFLARVWRSPLAATDGNKAHYVGVRAAALEAFCKLFRKHPLPLFPAALARLQWHAAHGHAIVLVSGTLRPLAACVASVVAQLLPSPSGAVPILIAATELESRGKHLTGRTAGEPVSGPVKGAAVNRLAEEHGVDLGRSFAYGDQYADCLMLRAVGHPTAVNPSVRLRLLARRRGWPVVFWGNTLAPHQEPAAERLRAAF